MHSDTSYTGTRQGKMLQWVALRPIFVVCARETGYEGGGIRIDAWWRQEAPETQLRETLEEISQEATGGVKR